MRGWVGCNCGVEFYVYKQEDIADHLRECGYGVPCEGCFLGFDSRPGLAQHLKLNNGCRTCHRHFSTENGLRQHEQVHLPRTVECFKCNEKFISFSAMILHLEQEICWQDPNHELEHAAATCFQWRRFVERSSRIELLNGVVDGNPFYCERCYRTFPFLSALFQHATFSNQCDASIDDGALAKLVRWLELVIEYGYVSKR
ncbi:hypothetical protein P152DRAFT_394017 [Eremomyces bilateralis CBS 781.70]|uniref:C2H2-type domain-containing protein n=1 Tax=Eremomyces bilateralis CBS 781.70 TaxID=1392243 RepID=A0A6G1G7J5_9PEZI|nr:uncharacterized protein P152DRAFT_394017 [Eremomyces bilateralis CBS 781.70]KAF1813982.1 hypothetical protein P152DRAFT_394017 [Eremomyces bilateralis CBS 781.70]